MQQSFTRRSFAAAVCLVFLSLGPLVAKEMIPTPAETPVLGEFEPILVRTLLAGDDREASLAKVAQDQALRTQIEKHQLQLFSGPMLGCVTEKSARFWVRTAMPAEVQVVVSSQPDLAGPNRSKVVSTTAAEDFTARLEVDGLEPFSTYYYDVLVDGKGRLGANPPSFRTFPRRGQAARFDIGFGGGARYVPENERIWETIASFQPAAFLFLGDNVYIDQPQHRNVQRLYYYRRQLRPEFRRLTAGTSIYAIWDDHDFGANDCAGGLDPFRPDWKVPVWNVFRENWNNPAYGGGPQQPGCWFQFSVGDVDFFMTDGRYYRSFKDGTMLGPVQKKWLLDSLRASTAKFKVIASGTLWTEAADKGGKDSWWGVKGEREEIFSLIDRQRIGGVVLISADRHRTDIYKIERPDGYPLYEFETSKLTNRHTHGTKKEALFSYNKGNFFGMLTFDFELADPELTFRCITIDAQTVHSMNLRLSELQPPK